MTTATLPTPSIDRPIGAPESAVSPIARMRDAVCTLPAPTLPHDTLVAATVDDLASIHIITARTLAVVARKDRHIQPIATMITEHLPGLTAAVIGSAITVTLA